MATVPQNSPADTSARAIAVTGLVLCSLSLLGTWENSTQSLHVYRQDHTTEFVDQHSRHRGWSSFDTAHHNWNGHGATNGLTTTFVPGIVLRLTGLLVGILASLQPGWQRVGYHAAWILLLLGLLLSGADWLWGPALFGLGILMVFLAARRRGQEVAAR